MSRTGAIETIPGEFGFQVGYLEENAWYVELPHQCDEWSIAGGYSGVSREEAITSLEAFLAEGHQALERLRSMTA